MASTAVPADAGNNRNLSSYAFTYRLVIAFCALFTTSQSSHWSWRSLLAGWSVFSAAHMSCPRAFKSKYYTNPKLIHITFTHRWWLTRFEYSDHALGGLDSPSVPRVKYNNAVGMRLGDENIHTTFTLTNLRKHANIKQAIHKTNGQYIKLFNKSVYNLRKNAVKMREDLGKEKQNWLFIMISVAVTLPSGRSGSLGRCSQKETRSRPIYYRRLNLNGVRFIHSSGWERMKAILPMITTPLCHRVSFFADPIHYQISRYGKSVARTNEIAISRCNWSAPPVSRSNWWDRGTEPESGPGPWRPSQLTGERPGRVVADYAVRQPPPPHTHTHVTAQDQDGTRADWASGRRTNDGTTGTPFGSLADYKCQISGI